MNSSLSHGDATQKNSLDNSRLHGFGMLNSISGNPGDRCLLSQLVFLRHCQPSMLITRRVIQRANINWHLSELFIPPFLLYAMLFWLAFF